MQPAGLSRYGVLQSGEILALQRLAGNRAVTRTLRSDGGPKTALQRSSLQVSRLTTSAASLGETGIVGQGKALVGQSNYVKIKQELDKYYRATQPEVRRQHLQRMLDLIAKWMKANAKSTTPGNLARMVRLQALQAEIQQELPSVAAGAPAPLSGVGKVGARPGAPLTVKAATITEPEPALSGVGKQVARPGEAFKVGAAKVAAPALPEKAGPLVLPQADEVTEQLGAMKDQIDTALTVSDKVKLLKKAQTKLEELLPLLTDPSLATVRRAVSDYAQAILKALPALEEQAAYMEDLTKGQEKFAYLSLAGVKAVAMAVSAAREATSNKAGMTAEAAIMRQARITDAEMAAIKIYTAPDYRYMNAGLEKNRGEWLQNALKAHGEAGPRIELSEILGAPLKPGEQGPLSPADTAAAEGVRYAKFAVEGLKKLPAWKGETYRGMGLSPDDFKAKFEDQKDWSANAFTSTSVKKQLSRTFATNESKQGRVGFLMQFEVTDGRDINQLSIFRNEGEIMLLPGATAKILRIETDSASKIKIVHLRQTS
ncbi:MAG TPA: hypothetical protein VHT75_19140 [Acidimicrobiales bacterium]|nr:hypothetical protein [Acidimicrobiales bacterium]